jgi:hypothetical protein
MISDDDLLLYYYRELDAAEHSRIGQLLAEQPELAQRLHRMIARLDAAAASPEVPVPAAFEERWRTALQAAAAKSETVRAHRRPSRQPLWLAAAAAVALGSVALVTWKSTQTIDTAAPTAGPTVAESGGSAYERGLQRHLASTEQQLVSLPEATPEERARLIGAIVEQNRIYALAAERAGEPQLARVLRAFSPILEDVASGKAQSDAGSLAQLAFELRVMQARLGTEHQPINSL